MAGSAFLAPVVEFNAKELKIIAKAQLLCNNRALYSAGFGRQTRFSTEFSIDVNGSKTGHCANTIELTFFGQGEA